MKFVHVRTNYGVIVAVPAQLAQRLDSYLHDFASSTGYATYDLHSLIRLPGTFLL